MLEPVVDNPLGLPYGQEDNRLHQLRLTQPEGTDAARRTNLCTTVLEHIATAKGMFFFNSLHQSHQVAAILIIEEENTHT